ncbi:hypothetical protein ACVXZ0_12165 [Staphylococcus aureus]
MAVNVRDYIAENYDLFINGEFVKGSSDETIEVTNPDNWRNTITYYKSKR